MGSSPILASSQGFALSQYDDGWRQGRPKTIENLNTSHLHHQIAFKLSTKLLEGRKCRARLFVYVQFTISTREKYFSFNFYDFECEHHTVSAAINHFFHIFKV